MNSSGKLTAIELSLRSPIAWKNSTDIFNGLLTQVSSRVKNSFRCSLLFYLMSSRITSSSICVQHQVIQMRRKTKYINRNNSNNTLNYFEGIKKILLIHIEFVIIQKDQRLRSCLKCCMDKVEQRQVEQLSQMMSIKSVRISLRIKSVDWTRVDLLSLITLLNSSRVLWTQPPRSNTIRSSTLIEYKLTFLAQVCVLYLFN